VQAVWLEALADAVLFLVHDDGLLSGMAMDAPSALSVEALASTELMMVRTSFGVVVVIRAGA